MPQNHPSRLRLAGVTLAAALAATLMLPAQAQTFTKTLRMVVSTPPGGGMDLNGRVMAEKLSARVGQPVIVENKPGAAGLVAAQYLMNSPADGHTMILTSPQLTVLSARGSSSFDIRRDFTAVVQQSSQPLIMYVSVNSPFHSVRDVINYAKANPGKLNYGSLGIGSVQNLMWENFKRVTGTDIVHVPFKGAGETSAAIMAGVIQVDMAGNLTVGPLVKGGKVRALVASTAKGFAGYPGMLEAGVPNYDMPVWTGILVHSATPKPMVDALNAAFNSVYQDPAVVAYYQKSAGYDPTGGSPEQFSKVISNEVEAFRIVIRDAKIKFD